MDPSIGLSAGDVVARRQRFFLVTDVGDRHVTLVAITSPDRPRHRAHVYPRDWPELAMSGLENFDIVFACEHAFRITPRQIRPVGHVSPLLLERVQRAVARERVTRTFEDFAGVASSLVNRAASVGRPAAAVRYA